MVRPFSEAALDNCIEFPVKSHDSPRNQLPDGEECHVIPIMLRQDQFDKLVDADSMLPPEYVESFNTYITPVQCMLECMPPHGEAQALYLHYYCLNSAWSGAPIEEILEKVMAFAGICQKIQPYS